MWSRIIATAITAIVAAVAYNSFAYREDADRDGEDKSKFSPMELEMRHVGLNRPFDISVGQEVLFCDGDTRGYLSLVDTRQSLEFSFVLDGVEHNFEFAGPKDRTKEAGGYMIVLLETLADPQVEIEDIYGKNNYLAKIVVSGL